MILDIAEVKKIFGQYYPDSNAVGKIKSAELIENMLVVNFTNNQSIIYRVNSGGMTVYRKKESMTHSKMTSVIRDIKLSLLIENE